MQQPLLQQQPVVMSQQPMAYQQQPPGYGQQGSLPGMSNEQMTMMKSAQQQNFNQGGGGKSSFDVLTEQKLMAVKNYAFFQSNVAMEAITGGCAPNKYVFGDIDRPQGVPGRESSKNPTIPHALFVAEEESKCCYRFCCPGGAQPFIGKIYHANAPTAGKECCGCYSGHMIDADKSRPAVMTFAKPGLFAKCCPGCCVCMDCCQQEMFVYSGDKGPAEPDQLISTGGHTGHSKVPCGGGGCTPQIDLFGANQDQFGVVEGPTCFGGCYDLCCSTPFSVSSQKGKAGDLAFIEKQKPEDCYSMCCAVCSDADQYKIEMRDEKLTSAQRAQILATAVQLDLLFFENDNHFCEVVASDDGKAVYITITLCMWYMWGWLCPVAIWIPCPSKAE